MSWKDFPVSCFAEGARSTLGGALAFFLGLAGGTLLIEAHAGSLSHLDWATCLVGWMFLILLAMVKPWGILLLPFLGVMLYGLIWREWNRLVGASLIAIVFSSAAVACSGENLFAALRSGGDFPVAMGVALSLLLAGILREWWFR